MPFLILFILIPIAEIYAFIEVGDEIGILKTLALCVLTALIGGYLVRQQGMETLRNAQTSFSTGNLPIKELFNGLCIVISGALLMTPGFVTDIIGFLLLIPFIREILRKFFQKHGKFDIKSPQNTRNAPPSDDDIIEGDYKEVPKDNEKLEK